MINSLLHATLRLTSLLLVFTSLAFGAIDLNKATKEELMSVKGIGPKSAEAILEYREKQGAFKSVEELVKVRGFGKAKVEKLKGELFIQEKREKAKTAQ